MFEHNRKQLLKLAANNMNLHKMEVANKLDELKESGKKQPEVQKIKGSGKSGIQMAKFVDAKNQAKQRLETSKVIHSKKPMTVPGAPITPAVMHYNAMLPMIMEGLLQENLLAIQGY